VMLSNTASNREHRNETTMASRKNMISKLYTTTMI